MQKHILYILPICLALCTHKVNAQSIYTESGTTLYVTGSAAVDGAVSVSPTIYTEGAIQNGGTLLNEGEIQTKGDFSNTGTLTSTGDEVFIGTASQSVSGNLTGSNAFARLVVDKTGNPLTLGANAAVSTQANLVNGKIVLGTNNLSVAPSASITGYDAWDYIMTNGTGTLQRNVAASDVVFPVGNSSYNPVTLNNTGTSDVFSARVSDAVGCSGGNMGFTNKVNRTWHLSEANAGGSNVAITTQWATANEDATFNRSLSGIADDSGTGFNLPVAYTAAGTAGAGVWTQTQSGQTTLSDRMVTSMEGVTVIGNTTFCAGGSVTFQAPANPAYTYQWYKYNVLISGAANSSYVATATGQYHVAMFAGGTCAIKTKPIAVNVMASSSTPTIAFTTTTNNSVTLCAGAGSTVTMTCPTSNVYEYAWYRNGTLVNYQTSPNNTYTVGAASVGTDVYTLSITNPNSVCLSAQSSPLTVIKTVPPATITPTGATTFCTGGSTTLNANTGTNYTYQWRRGTTIVQVGGTSYVPTASGNHTVRVTDANLNCTSTSAPVTITVNPLPTANAGADKNVCLGASVQIGVAALAGNTYSWSPATALSNVSIANPMASPTATTTYTLTVTNTATGCIKTDAVVVTRLSSPTTPSLASTASPVCEGATVSITPTSTGAASIDWYKNGVFLYNKPTTFIHTVSAVSAAADNYTIKSIGTNTCLSSFSNAKTAWVQAAATPTITANPLAVGNIATVCVPGGTSGNAALTASSTTASPAYSWKLGANFIAGANTNAYTTNVTPLANNKVISVQATYPNGCVKTSSSLTVKLVTTGCTPKVGTDKEDADALITADASFEAYPNPTNALLNVVISHNELSNGKLLLYNELGQVVLTKEISFFAGKANTELNLQALAAGVYFLSFENKVIKVVKE